MVELTARIALESMMRATEDDATSAGLATSNDAADGTRVAKLLDDHSTALVNMSGHVFELRKALTMARDLIATIEQTTNNTWWVNADDPETAVCDTFDAIEKALATDATDGATGGGEVRLCPSDAERMREAWADLGDHLGHEAAAVATTTGGDLLEQAAMVAENMMPPSVSNGRIAAAIRALSARNQTEGGEK